MTWTTVELESPYDGLRAERYQTEEEEYKIHNRTCYYDVRNGHWLGVIYDHKNDKEKQEIMQEIIEELNRRKVMYTRFDSFDNVAKMYAEIVPLRGKRKAEDVRPIWARRYHWRRVVKMNDNKYVLHDGDYTWQRTFEESCNFAPITWERRADGDYITIRNCHAPYYSVSRYSFLSSALPKGLWFRISNGKHYIVDGQTEHYLPKFKMHYDHNLNKQILDQDLTITFKHLGGNKFERVSELLPMKLRRIDKDLKAKYDPMIKEAWDWACVVLPILGTSMHDWSARGHHANKIGADGVWNWERECSAFVIREILENTEHEARLSLVALAAWSGGAFDNGSVDSPNKTFAPSKEAFRGFKKTMRKVLDVSAVELR